MVGYLMALVIIRERGEGWWDKGKDRGRGQEHKEKCSLMELLKLL